MLISHVQGKCLIHCTIPLYPKTCSFKEITILPFVYSEVLESSGNIRFDKQLPNMWSIYFAAELYTQTIEMQSTIWGTNSMVLNVYSWLGTQASALDGLGEPCVVIGI